VAVYAAPFATSRFSLAESVQHAVRESRRIIVLCEPKEPPGVFLGAVTYLPHHGLPATSAAVDHLIALARDPETIEASEAGQPLHVLAIGCATNIAAALLLAPDIARHVVVVWDAAYPHHWPWPNRSYNLEQDVRAARVLFDRAQLVYIPGYQVAEQLTLTREEAEQHVAPCGKLGAFLWHLFPRCAPQDACSRVLWDIANIAYMIEPRWTPSHFVASPGLAADLSWRARRWSRRQMREIHDVDRDAIFSDMFARLRGDSRG